MLALWSRKQLDDYWLVG